MYTTHVEFYICIFMRTNPTPTESTDANLDVELFKEMQNLHINAELCISYLYTFAELCMC